MTRWLTTALPLVGAGLVAACTVREPATCTNAVCRDAGKQPDATPQAEQILGRVVVHGASSTLTPGLTVSALRLDDTLVQTGVTQADGVFSIPIVKTGDDGDIYLKVVSPAYVDTTYNFQSADAVGGPLVTIDLYTPSTYAALFTTAAITPLAGTGVIEAVVGTPDGLPISDARFVARPVTGTVIYDDPTGHPDASAPATGADGTAYVLNATTTTGEFDFPSVEIPSRELRVFPGAVTETAVREQLVGNEIGGD